MRLETPRPLSEAEKHVLTKMLSIDFPGAEELRSQVSRALVVGKCDCGCPTVDIEVEPGVSPSPVRARHRLTPVEGRVKPLGGEPTADIILFVDDGRLACLEYVAYSDPAPSGWPHPDRIRVLRLDDPR